MSKSLLDFLRTETNYLEQAGLLRREPLVSSPQGPQITLDGREAVNLASGDYLALSQHEKVKEAAAAALKSHGVGVAAPRMMTGNLPLHRELEQTLAKWLGTDDAVLFPSGYHANTGLFEALLSDRDFVFCDEMVRPSIADGIRLCRARVYTFRNGDLGHLEDRLKRSRAARFRVIATDGVFALDGQCAPLREIYALAARYDALVAVDDSHGLGVLGESGRGTHVHLGLAKGPQVLTGTFGNALGGGAGGFVACSKEVATWLRQKSRPYLASTALAPPAAAAALEAIKRVKAEPKLRELLDKNVKAFRDAVTAQGYTCAPGAHPAVAVMIGNAVICQRTSDLLHKSGVFAMGFCHPVVPEGAARIRAQVTAAHSAAQLEKAAQAFGTAARHLQRR
jgi:glycine C-acetyltransferase